MFFWNGEAEVWLGLTVLGPLMPPDPYTPVGISISQVKYGPVHSLGWRIH